MFTSKIISARCVPVHLINIKFPFESHMHPVASFLQYVWKRVAAVLGLNSLLHSLASIWLNPSLCIEGSPFIWKPWVNKGIFMLSDLYKVGALKSFEKLCAQNRLAQN